MGKMKLKTVQNGTEGQSASLMANGSSTYRDENGYIIDGSGIFDASGNVVEAEWLEIEAGYNTIYTEGYPGFEIEVKWGSGNIDLPLPYDYGPNGLTCCVGFSIYVLRCTEPINGNPSDIVPTLRWITPLTAYITIPFYFFGPNGHIAHDYLYTIFSIPFIPHSQKNLDEES